ncbi:uncharacterized protein ACIB01_005012 [Guaruba guarouba]
MQPLRDERLFFFPIPIHSSQMLPRGGSAEISAVESRTTRSWGRRVGPERGNGARGTPGDTPSLVGGCGRKGRCALGSLRGVGRLRALGESWGGEDALARQGGTRSRRVRRGRTQAAPPGGSRGSRAGGPGENGATRGISAARPATEPRSDVWQRRRRRGFDSLAERSERSFMVKTKGLVTSLG